jgi:uncharacterized delta-60 repeat protein
MIFNQYNMKKTFAFIAITLGLLSSPLFSFSQAGTLDDTYGDQGIVMLSPGSIHDVAYDIVMLEDSTSMICGVGTHNGVMSGFLMHILVDGSQDMSFGTSGIVWISYGAETYAYKLLRQTDGKFVIGGLVYTVLPDSEFFIARFLPDGSPDLTFNSTGHFISAYSTDEEYMKSMAIQSDGKYILAGSTYLGNFSQLLFMRINSNGTLDTGFGTNGYTEIDAATQDESINGLGMLANGTIIGVGYGYQEAPLWGEQVFMAELTSSGMPAPGFGTNGVMIPAVFGDVSIAFDLLIDNDSLYLTGYMYNASNEWQLFLAKLNTGGIAYSGFGSNGISFLYLNPLNVGYEIMRTSDKKLYISGTTGIGGPGNRDFLLARFLPSGSLDNDFDADGYVITPIRPDWDEANALAMQPDGKIVLAGMTSGLSTSGNNDIAMTRYLNDFLPSGLYANFSANTLVACEGAGVVYTDLSISTDSTVLTWNWTFEGGTPSVSTNQNPVVTYANDGIYDVRLIVYDGIYIDTLLRENYITVESLPGQPAMPTGPSDLCGTHEDTFTTGSVMYADTYDWEVTPNEAGTITGEGISAVLHASSTWTGTCTIKVRGTSQCGNGPWSAGATCLISHNPVQFQLTGDGGYCTGDPGSELVLEGSETGVNYELYLAGAPTGNILPGTGGPLSFGFFSVTGLYSVSGYTDYCFEFMVGQVYVHEMLAPEQAQEPVGPGLACDMEPATYTTMPIDDADVYVWSLNPGEAGVLTPVFDTVHIAWTAGWTGTVNLSVHGENNCGEGPESEPAEISVNLSPNPEIIGNDLACSNLEEKYQTVNNDGSFYTWEVTGGEIIDGAGTYQATVLWGAPGEGSVTVTEETAQGCTTTTDPFSVTIEICESVSENSGETILVYPNPVKDVLNVMISQNNNSRPLQAIILNSQGQVMGSIEQLNSVKFLQINIAGYPCGIYMLKAINEDNTNQILRFIVSR